MGRATSCKRCGQNHLSTTPDSVSLPSDIDKMQKFVAAVVALCCISGSSATLINLINQCPYGITAFARSGSSATNSYNLGASGGYQQLDVGPSFPAGLIFASTTGSENNAQVWADRASRVGILRTRCSTCRTGGPCSEPKPAQNSRAHLVLLLQATQLEITAGANGRDTYDISLVVRLDFSSRAEPACSEVQ